MKRKGKYQKQTPTHKGMYSVLAVLAALAVLGISSVAFYKAGARSAAGFQETKRDSSIIIQETAEETPNTIENTTEPVIIETAERAEETTQTTKTPTQPTETTQPTTETVKPIEHTGTVLRSAGELKVRSGAGTSYSEIGRLKGGDIITIYEQKEIDGRNWGNIGYGWVCMDYVVFGVDNSVVSTYQNNDYFGDWLSSDGKCYMSIIQNGNGANISVVYTIADNVDMTWSMYGEFDEHGAIRYWNGVRKDHNGGVESVKYTNGEGAIVIDGLSLSWHESAEGPGEAGRFERVYNYCPNNSTGAGNSSGQGTSSFQSGSGSTATTEIPRRFNNDDIKQALMKEAKIELGYRNGDKFSMEYPMVTGYEGSSGKYFAFAKGIWNDENYYMNAVLQDVNGVLTVSKILSFEVK